MPFNYHEPLSSPYLHRESSSPLLPMPAERSPAHHLLSLPPEIRSLVYEHILSGPNKYILSPSAHAIHCYWDLDLHPAPQLRSPGTSAHPAANLLLTCRTLRTETQRAMTQHVHFYCSLHELELEFFAATAASSSSSYLPTWLRLSLRHISIYKTDPTRSDPEPVAFRDPFGSSTRSTHTKSTHFPSRYSFKFLADRTSLPHAELLRAFPRLETLNLVYFWPGILGRMKHRLESFFEGKRDDDLVNLVRIHFRSKADAEGQLVGNPEDDGGRNANGGNAESYSRPGVRISITGHFIEAEQDGPKRRRCLVSRDVLSHSMSSPSLPLSASLTLALHPSPGQPVFSLRLIH